MDKRNYAARDLANLVHPYTNLEAHKKEGPLVIERGEGVRVFDADGKAYIEGMSGLWCTALGFSERRLIDAAVRALETLPFYHSFSGKAPAPTIYLAEKLLSMAPRPRTRPPLTKVLFSNSGSEANDAAVKLIWYYNNAVGRPAKKKIISRRRAYHGVTVCSGSLTGIPANHRDFDLPIAPILHADCPLYYRFAEDGESEEDFAGRLAGNLERMIISEGPDTVAAFFAEPVMGAGGVITPPAGYFQKIQAVLKKYDVMFVVDEVITGCGRTGNMWGCETYGLEPDMLTTAKALSSAYVPISALMISEPIFEAMVAESGKIGVFGHGYTYSGHPVAAAVALEALNIYQERDIPARVREKAPLLQDGLTAFKDHPLVGDVRGVGLVAAVELVRDKRTREAFDIKEGIGPYLIKRAQQYGLITRSLGDVIAFAPPLIIEPEDIAAMLDCFAKALDDTRAMFGK